MTTIQVVDEAGSTIGEIEKLAAHDGAGVWHRAVSVFLFDISDRLLIQRRAKGKYHFAGLWANSCCSHPSAGETVSDAAKRAMLFELGVITSIREIGVVRYEAVDSISGQIEREHDHILVGRLTDDVSLNPDEVAEIRWVSIAELKAEIRQNPEIFAPWLSAILEEFPKLP